MKETFDRILEYVIYGIEALGVIVIVMSAVRTVVRYVMDFFRYPKIDVSTLRLTLGQSMVMALEFLVAADILKSALDDTSWNDILLLAALIGLRTLLNYLLENELEHLSSVCNLKDVS